MEFKSYDSSEEMYADLERAMRAADLRVRPWQEQIDVGAFILTAAEGEPVYSEVLERYTEPRLRQYRFCRAHSIFVAEGELGDIHVATVIAVLTKELFEEARANGWRIPGSDGGGT